MRAAWWVKEAVCRATVAFLGTLPVSAAFFQAVPSGAILWNVLFGPILGTAGVAGGVIAVVGGAFGVEPLAPVVRTVADGLTVALSLLDLISGTGAGCFPVPPSGIVDRPSRWWRPSRGRSCSFATAGGRGPRPSSPPRSFSAGSTPPMPPSPGGIFPSRR